VEKLTAIMLLYQGKQAGYQRITRSKYQMPGLLYKGNL
jgi:hypothetical protein